MWGEDIVLRRCILSDGVYINFCLCVALCGASTAFVAQRINKSNTPI